MVAHTYPTGRCWESIDSSTPARLLEQAADLLGLQGRPAGAAPVAPEARAPLGDRSYVLLGTDRVERRLAKPIPEVLFVCIHNAGGSQM
jgi:hypothetical protein